MRHQCHDKDFLNKYFKHVYKPILLVYNLVLAMLWRHLENVELEKVKLQWFTTVPLLSVVQFVADGDILMCTTTDLAVLCGGNGGRDKS
ncbi:hypothetical protein IFM89_026241 [Coptis chinensis]|uniref:Uncharacterized protein n=1 Tax=Coptis chinensis TaxID=261450 RepID=A0A835M0T7_9MAGN|nr:hypothetical protein IFM89_026241 [Coptis chinensis]